MKINWKIRLKNRQFWLGVVGTVGTCALSLANAFDLGAYASLWVEAMEGAATSALALLALLGVVVDPTTEGVGDSSQALRYELPRQRGLLTSNIDVCRIHPTSTRARHPRGP